MPAPDDPSSLPPSAPEPIVEPPPVPEDALEPPPLDEGPALPTTVNAGPIPRPEHAVLVQSGPGRPDVYVQAVPKGRVSICALIALGFFVVIFVLPPPFGCIPATIAYALARTATARTTDTPINSPSRALANTIRIGSIMAMIVELLVACFFLYLIFTEYNEFIDQWHGTLSLGGEILAFLEKVFDYFFHK